jgi:DNA-binding protein Fis
MERLLVDEAMRRANGSQTLAARLLGVSRQALNNRLRRERTAEEVDTD